MRKSMSKRSIQIRLIFSLIHSILAHRFKFIQFGCHFLSFSFLRFHSHCPQYSITASVSIRFDLNASRKKNINSKFLYDIKCDRNTEEIKPNSHFLFLFQSLTCLFVCVLCVYSVSIRC